MCFLTVCALSTHNAGCINTGADDFQANFVLSRDNNIFLL